MDVPAEVERVFAPIAAVVEDFAAAHSLQIEKCARGNVGWELTRPHPEGGALSLLMLFKAELGLGVGSVWQFPCEEMSLVYSHFHPLRGCPIEPAAVREALEAELQHVMQVRFGYWTHLSPLSPAAAAEG